MDKYSEIPEARYPMQNFVYMSDNSGGIVVSTKVLGSMKPFQEIRGVDLALTLLRSVGMLSRSGLLTRVS